MSGTHGLPTTRNTAHARYLRRIALALAAAVVSGTAVVLGLSAALDMEWTPKSAMLLALAAVWLPQALIGMSRRRK